MDYWSTWCKGPFACVLSTEFYSTYYPEVQKAINEDVNDSYFQDVAKDSLQQGADPTHVLSIFLETILQHSRYALDYDYVVRDIINITIEYGADPSVGLMALKMTDARDYSYNFEDYCENFPVRGYIIDVLQDKLPIDESDWKNVSHKYWEYLNYKTASHDIFMVNAKKYLKYCSKYLQTL